MNSSKFYNQDGSLTSYGLACGYIEESHVSRMCRGDALPCGIRVWMYKESNCYHVRGYNVTQEHPEFWETFDTLTEARREYKKQGGIYKGQ